MPTSEGSEGFYIDGGRKADRAIHDEILNIDPAAQQGLSAFSIQWMISRGIDPARAAALVGVDSAAPLADPGGDALR